jgi:hypothetical protein
MKKLKVVNAFFYRLNDNLFNVRFIMGLFTKVQVQVKLKSIMQGLGELLIVYFVEIMIAGYVSLGTFR